jgi:hypothetical protein
VRTGGECFPDLFRASCGRRSPDLRFGPQFHVFRGSAVENNGFDRSLTVAALGGRGLLFGLGLLFGGGWLRSLLCLDSAWGGGDGQAAEAIALQFFEHAKCARVGATGGGLVTLQHAADGLHIDVPEHGKRLPGMSVEIREFAVMLFALDIHLDFSERTFDGADTGEAPGGSDHLVDEIAFDVIGRRVAIDKATGVLDELFGIFIGQQDDVAAAKVVAHSIPRGFGLAFGGDGSVGLRAVGL